MLLEGFVGNWGILLGVLDNILIHSTYIDYLLSSFFKLEMNAVRGVIELAYQITIFGSPVALGIKMSIVAGVGHP